MGRHVQLLRINAMMLNKEFCSTSQLHIIPSVLLQPPVIRLYDLHVRLDAAVKSGVQLLLLEKGPTPEMFRLQFVTKSEARL